MGVNRFYVLLFSMMLLGAAMAAGEYSPSSNGGEVSKPQPKVQSGSYDKPAHKPEEWEKHTMGKNNPKLFDEPKFDHDGPAKKPDFHFVDMPHPEMHSESYDKEAAHWMPKPKESENPYEVEPKFEHNEPIEKPDFYHSDMPHPKIHTESYNKPVIAPSVPKPEESEKPTLENVPESKSYDEPKFQRNESIEKPDLHFHNLSKAESTKPVGEYNPKPEAESTKSIEDYHLKPEAEPTKPVGDYASKPKTESTKPVNDYHPKPNYKADPHYETPKLNIPKPEEAFPAAVEGIVICKSASGYVPVKGAVVRITCMGVDDQGYNNALASCQTSPTDAKGYFFKTLPAASNNKVKNSWENCKAFLDQSPMEECGVPSNVNKGVDGYPLSSHRVLQDKHLKLYPIGPFFYTPEPMAKPTVVKKAPAAGGGY